MINFPIIYPYKITNGYGTELCGIPAGGTLIIGPSNINGTLNLYNSYAELVEQYLSDQTFGAQDMSDNWLGAGIAASAFSNLRANIIEYQKTSYGQLNNLTVTQYVKLTPVTTAVRNSIPQDSGTLVLNSDTNEIEVLKSGQWGTSMGPQGARGYQGFKGNTGTAGAQGPRGYQGFKGNTGTAGAQGARGYQGASGASSSSSPDVQTFSYSLAGTTQGVTQLIWGTIFYPPSKMTVKSISIYCTQTGSGNTRVGIYDSSYALLQQSDNKTSLAGGINTFTLSSPYTMTRGTRYAIVVQSRANGALILGHTSTLFNSPYELAKIDANNGADPGSGMSASVDGSSTALVMWANLSAS